MSAEPGVEWKELHDRFYRKWDVYRMQWTGVDLDTQLVVGSPFGGPVAMTRDRNKLLLAPSDRRQVVSVYTSSGDTLAVFPWEKSRLISMGWSDREELVIVAEDAMVTLYSVFGERLCQFTLGSEVERERVVDAVVWSGGVVVRTAKNEIYSCVDFTQPQVLHLASPKLDAPPSAMTIIEPLLSPSKTLQVLLATVTGSIVVVDQFVREEHLIGKGPFLKLAVTPQNGKMIAAYTDQGELFVCSSDFTRVLTKFSIDCPQQPDQFNWCGSDTVVMFWTKNRLLLMVGPNEEWVSYKYSSPLVFVAECDGVRIITNTACEFLHRVPKCTEDIFKIGSLAPAARLYDAFEQFERQSSKADELIRSIKSRNQLVEAVESCVEAAAHELDSSRQRQLLQAASYGKCFCDYFNAENFVDSCKTMRVIGSVRVPSVGIPITYQQYLKLTPDALIDRLTNRHRHLLALRVCEYLRIAIHRVLVHWACAKVKKSTNYSDSEVRDIVWAKLSTCPGISFVDIAQTAYRGGRQRLATMLLDNEPCPADQVPLLMSMGENALALNKAVDGGDTDLSYLVLLHLMRTCGVLTDVGVRPSRGPSSTADATKVERGLSTNRDDSVWTASQKSAYNNCLKEFLQSVQRVPQAVSLLAKLCREANMRDILKLLYSQTENHMSYGMIEVADSYQFLNVNDRIRGLKAAETFFQESKEIGSFYARSVEDQIKILSQTDLEPLTQGRSRYNSLGDTLFQLIVSGQGKKALKLKSDLKVPDKRFWWIKIRALAANLDWDGLMKFSAEKKSPVGYEPFVTVCLDKNNLKEADRYIPKVSEASRRAELFFKTGNWAEATEAASQANDHKLLGTIAAKCGDRQLQARISQIIGH